MDNNAGKHTSQQKVTIDPSLVGRVGGIGRDRRIP